MNNTGGPADIWAVDGIDAAELIMSPEGHRFLPRAISPSRLTLIHTNLTRGDLFG